MSNRHHEPYTAAPQKQVSGRWQGRITFYDPDTGKRRETTKTFATEREAKKWSQKQEELCRENPNRQPPGLLGLHVNPIAIFPLMGRLARLLVKPLRDSTTSKPLLPLLAHFQNKYRQNSLPCLGLRAVPSGFTDFTAFNTMLYTQLWQEGSVQKRCQGNDFLRFPRSLTTGTASFPVSFR